MKGKPTTPGRLWLVPSPPLRDPDDPRDAVLLGVLACIGAVPLVGAALGGRWDLSTLAASAGLTLLAGHELVLLLRSVRRARA